MTQTYGFPSETWEEAKEEVRQTLIRRARNHETITYSDLVIEIQAIVFESDSYALASMLGQVSCAERTAGRGMLSALVVHKDDGWPGAGFFRLAEELGEQVEDKEEFWVKEFTYVTNSWSEI